MSSKITKLIILGVASVVGTSLNTSAATLAPSSSASVEPAKAATSNADLGTPEKAQTDEADQIITNRQLRASTGSLSNWSINSSWQYKAGSLSDPFNALRPNLTTATDIPAIQSLAGTIGARYRIDTTHSVALKTGLFMLAPFHRSVSTTNAGVREQFDEGAGNLTVSDPTLSFQKLFRLGDVQNVSTFETALLTSEFLRNAGFRASLYASHQFMYEVKKTGLSLGLFFDGTRYFHDKDSVVTASGGTRDLRPNQAAWAFGAYPAVEYVLSSKLNLRTVSGVWVYELRRNQQLARRRIYQSVGLGISVSRDFFLYPNIQFIPQDLRAENTNVGVNANINVF